MKFRKNLLLLTGIILFVLILIYQMIRNKESWFFFLRESPVIKVGVLHSLTGTMAMSEKPVVDATVLAIDEINKAGGINGTLVKAIVMDGKSDPDVFKEQALRLIRNENVSVIFGCWTSASRKAVKPVVEQHQALLFYPVQYEGLEESPNIIYMGAAPNQQLIPAVTWSLEHLGKRFYLIGSDYIFPRVANKIAKEVISHLGGEVVKEKYVPLGDEHFTDAMKEIVITRPDVILNTINGSSNIAFFRKIHKLDDTFSGLSIMSMSITENEVMLIHEAIRKEHVNDSEFIQSKCYESYACWNYFQSIDSPLNRSFVNKFRKIYGADLLVTDPMEAAYVGVHLWAQAVRENRINTSGRNIKNTIYHLSYHAPEGFITIADNSHARKTVRIGKVNRNGAFDIVWFSSKPVNPVVFPPLLERSEWMDFLAECNRNWAGQWEAPKSAAISEVDQ